MSFNRDALIAAMTESGAIQAGEFDDIEITVTDVTAEHDELAEAAGRREFERVSPMLYDLRRETIAEMEEHKPDLNGRVWRTINNTKPDPKDKRTFVPSTLMNQNQTACHIAQAIHPSALV